MRRTLWALCAPLFLLVALPGCRIVQEEHLQYPLEVHLQVDFRGENVRVEVDRELVFEGRVETDDVLGFAEIIRLDLTPGRHRIRVRVGDTFGAETSFNFQPPMALGVQFFSEIPQGVAGERGVHYRVAEYFTYKDL